MMIRKKIHAKWLAVIVISGCSDFKLKVKGNEFNMSISGIYDEHRFIFVEKIFFADCLFLHHVSLS